MAQLSIALSGGGHRASLWALGAMQYVADSEKNLETTSIASVSGGSITNGFVGQQVRFDDIDGAEFQELVTNPLLRQLTQHGSLFASWHNRAYVAVLVASAVATLVVPWLLPIHWSLRVVVFLAGLSLVLLLAGQRGRAVRGALRRCLFSPNGRSTPLREMHEGTDHVICATDLRSGDHFYFARDLAYSYQYGTGGPGDIDVATAVAASAALPFAFPPLRISTVPMKLQPFDSSNDERCGAGRHAVHLVDGGVYDNMGDQWAAGYQKRSGRLPDHYRQRQPDELIVANASAGKDWMPRKLLGVPIVREVVALLADQSIQYDNTTAHRRTALIARFQLAQRDGAGLRGVYVGIDRSPFLVADRFAGTDAVGQRATAVLNVLGDTRANRTTWCKQAERSAGEGTHLSKIDRSTAAAIVHHAYVLTMCNAHIVLGHPLLPIPNVRRFEVV